MAASRISTDALEMFYGPISQEENRRQKRPIEPARIVRDRYIDFNLERKRDNEIFNRNNEETINTAFNRFVDEVKGQIEAWSQREFGWVLEGIVAAYVNVARSRYGPFRGRSYMPLPKKLQAKKAIINVQNGDNMGYSCCFISTTTRCKLSFERFIEENLPTNSIGSVLLKSEWRGDHGRRLRARAESVENIQVQKSR